MRIKTENAAGRPSGKSRLALLDTIRGITIVSMILFHGAWDVVYIAGINWPWYHSRGAFFWQQSICWTFILLSGMCIPFSRHLWKRGLTVSFCGLLVTAVTVLFLSEDRVVFGVLTLIGSAMLILAAARPLLEKVRPIPGLFISAYLFFLTRWVNSGFLMPLPGIKLTLPVSLYRGSAATWLGFTDPGFWSTDYFSLIPWIFLYLCGYFLTGYLMEKKVTSHPVFKISIPPFSVMGRHSLLIYLLHQPVLYLLTGVLLPLILAG